MAITQQDVQTALVSVITTLPDYTNEGKPTPTIALANSAQITVPAFATLFANAADMTVASLSAIDGGNLGFAPSLTAWHAQGLI